jgi:hypothetical protein
VVFKLLNIMCEDTSTLGTLSKVRRKAFDVRVRNGEKAKKKQDQSTGVSESQKAGRTWSIKIWLLSQRGVS